MCSDGSACCFYYHDVVNRSMENKFFFTARQTLDWIMKPIEYL